MERRHFLKLVGWSAVGGAALLMNPFRLPFFESEAGIDTGEQEAFVRWLGENLKGKGVGEPQRIEVFEPDDCLECYVKGLVVKDREATFSKAQYFTFAYDPQVVANVDRRNLILDNLIDQLKYSWKKAA